MTTEKKPRGKKVVTVKAEVVEQKELAIVENNSELQLPPHVENIPGLDIGFAKKVISAFQGFFEQASQYEEEAKTIVVIDIHDIATMSRAREMRLSLQKVRTGAEKQKDSAKAGLLVQTRFIDSMFNAVKMVTMPIEKHLDNQEKFVENEIKRIKAEKREERITKLAPYEVDVTYIAIEDMTDEAFANFLQSSKIIFDQKQKEIEEVEEKARLDQIALDEQKAKQAEIDAEQARIKKEQDERQAELDAEAERLAEVAREIDEKRLADEEEARLKRVAEDLARQQAEQAPDKEKLQAFANELLALNDSPNLDVSSPKAKKIEIAIREMLTKMDTYITSNTKAL